MGKITQGISRKQLALITARHVKEGTRSEKLKEGWRIVKEIEANADPLQDILADEMGVCSNCLEAGWLVAKTVVVEKCLNCGQEWLVISG